MAEFAAAASPRVPLGGGGAGSRALPGLNAGAVDERVRRQAAAALDSLLAADRGAKKGASIKRLTMGKKVYAKQATHACTVETLRHLPLLRAVAVEAKLAVDDGTPTPAPTGAVAGMKPCLLYVLLYELLLGVRGADALRLPGAGGAARKVAAAETEVRRAADALRRAHGAAVLRDVLPALSGERAASTSAKQPRDTFARVNALALAPRDALKVCDALAEELGATPDAHVPLGLAVPASSARALAEHPRVADGSVILQGKSSCLAALALSPEPGAVVVDCCAAPGNKTSHLAALVGRQGTVLAVERDAGRLKTLRRRVAHAFGSHADVVQCVHADFLELAAAATTAARPPGGKKRLRDGAHADADAADATLRAATCVLVDAPCSGSGTAQTRGDDLVAHARAGGSADAAAAAAREDKRAAALGRLQTKLLTAALSLPSARRVVYSTCSVHAAENEHVVGACMAHASSLGYSLHRALSRWPRRGDAASCPPGIDADLFVRVDPTADRADGFFVALFVKSAPVGAVGEPSPKRRKKRV